MTRGFSPILRFRSDATKPNWEKLRDGELDWEIFRFRAHMLQAARRFFEERDFLEIEPPFCVPHPTLDANIRSIPLTLETPERRIPAWLHTSPEHAMKKLLAAGADRIVSFGKVFRQGEVTAMHNPEYTMIEWYRRDADYRDILADTEELVAFIAREAIGGQQIQFQGLDVDLSLPFDRKDIRTLFRDKAGIDLDAAKDDESFRREATQVGFPFSSDDDWESLFFKIFLDRIEPGLGSPKPVFVTDYPARMGLMAKTKPDDPRWVERAELYIAGVELANGYSELDDPVEQRTRFEADQRIKQTTEESAPIDWELIRALESGIGRAAGMALGFDRLVMLLLDKPDIRDVILFPVHDIIEKDKL
jgi:lysyl-tRNA synthetase class 2